MADRFDVVIVGARAAGAPLATLLARDGVRVCVVDQARFPSDTASTHVVQSSGVHLLDDLGVLDELYAVTPALENVTMRLDDASIVAGPVSAAFGAPILCPRRITLDQILVAAAGRAGAEIRTRTTVTGLLEAGGRVTGVRTSSGDIEARLVVGADGVTSTVARLVGAEEYAVSTPGRAFTWSYFDAPQAPRDGMWFGKVGDRGYLACPTDGGQFLALVAVPMSEGDLLRSNREDVITSNVAHWPDLAAALDGATRVGPVRATLDWHGFFRTSTGPGWALVGDAGHFKDPTPGQGISDALRQSARLAPAIRASLAGPDPDRPLRDWWRWRDRDAWQMYWFANDMGAPDLTLAVQQEILRRIATDDELSAKLFQVLNHDVAPDKLMGIGLLLRATLSELRRGGTPRRKVLHEVTSLMRDAVSRQRAARRLPSLRVMAPADVASAATAPALAETGAAA